MRANQLLKFNIDTLLRVRGQSRKDLAQWCHKSESWISKIYKETRRGFSLRDLDRIAEFFGIATYQLFQPGISRLTERRSHLERRSEKERRIGHTARIMMGTAAEIDAHRPHRKGGLHVAVVASSPHGETLKRLTAEFERRVAALLQVAEEPRDEAATPRRKVATAHKSHRRVSGSDSGED